MEHEQNTEAEELKWNHLENMAQIWAKEKKQEGKQSLQMAQLEVEKLHLQLQLQASHGITPGPSPTFNFPQDPTYFQGNGLELDLTFQDLHETS